MKILELDLKNKRLTLVPEDLEDLYYLALIVRRGDIVYAWTKRSTKVEREFGVERGERVRVYLGIRVEEVEFSEFTNRLRIKGVIIDAPESFHIKGSHHTILVSPGKEVIVSKEVLLNFELEVLKRSAKPRGHVVVLSVGDDHTVIGVLGIGRVIPIAEIANKQRKDFKTKSLKSIYEKYLNEIASCLKRIIERYEATMVIVLCPNMIREWITEALRKMNVYKKVKISVLNVSEGGLAGIYEFLRSDAVQTYLKEARLVYEQRQVDEVYIRLMREPSKVSIGFNEVKIACEMGAIERLLVLDKLIRELPDNEDLLNLIKMVESMGGKIVIVNEKGVAGSKLKSLGGLVALNRFRLEKPTFN